MKLRRRAKLKAKWRGCWCGLEGARVEQHTFPCEFGWCYCGRRLRK